MSDPLDLSRQAAASAAPAGTRALDAMMTNGLAWWALMLRLQRASMRSFVTLSQASIKRAVTPVGEPGPSLAFQDRSVAAMTAGAEAPQRRPLTQAFEQPQDSPGRGLADAATARAEAPSQPAATLAQAVAATAEALSPSRFMPSEGAAIGARPADRLASLDRPAVLLKT